MITFDDAYADLVDYALPALRRVDFAALVFVPTSYIGAKSDWIDPRAEPHPIMTDRQIVGWARRGIEFGAHGRSHSDLTQLDENSMRSEIADSGTILNKLLGYWPRCFAYPYGRHNERVRAEVGRYYSMAFSADNGLNYACTDPLTIRRNMVDAADWVIDVRARVSLGWSPTQFVRSRLQLRSRALRLARRA